MPSEDNKMPAYMAILMEDFHAKFEIIMEHIDGVENRLIRRMDNMEQKLCNRMDVKFAHQNTRFDAIESILEIHSIEFKDHGQRLARIEKAVPYGQASQ